jgi:hypothetical protein
MPGGSPDQSPGVIQSEWSRPQVAVLSPNPTDDTPALIHLKLRLWLESVTDESADEPQLMQELLAMLTDENAAAIIQSLSSDELSTPFGTAALEHWLKVDVTGAANWIAARSDTTEDQACLVAHKLLEDAAGLQNLQSYCDQLPDTEWKRNVLIGASLEVLSKDPAEAINLAQRMNPGIAQTNVLRSVAYDWMSRDPDAALDWILNVNDPPLRETLIAAGAEAAAATDPDLAAGWLVSTVKSEGILNDTALHIIETWIAKDPAGAANWVARFPDGSTREAAVGIVSRLWLQSDRGAATVWIQNLPEGDEILTSLNSDSAESAVGSQN